MCQNINEWNGTWQCPVCRATVGSALCSCGHAAVIIEFGDDDMHKTLKATKEKTLILYEPKNIFLSRFIIEITSPLVFKIDTEGNIGDQIETENPLRISSESIISEKSKGFPVTSF